MQKVNKRGFSLVELLVVLGIVALLASLLFPAIQAVREGARRSQCSNQMRQVGIATHSYESNYLSFPPVLSVTSAEWLLHWQAVILPYVEHANLKESVTQQIKEGEHVYRLVGERTTNVPVYQCPTNPDRGLLIRSNTGLFAFTDYCGVAGVQARDSKGILVAGLESQRRNKVIRFAEVHDGLSNTLLFGERPPNSHRDGYGAWLGSQDTLAATIGVSETLDSLQQVVGFEVCENYDYGFGRGERGSKCGWTHHWSFHPGGASFALADGAVKFFPYSISGELLAAMSTRAGGETLTIDF